MTASRSGLPHLSRFQSAYYRAVSNCQLLPYKAHEARSAVRAKYVAVWIIEENTAIISNLQDSHYRVSRLAAPPNRYDCELRELVRHNKPNPRRGSHRSSGDSVSTDSGMPSDEEVSINFPARVRSASRYIT